MRLSQRIFPSALHSRRVVPKGEANLLALREISNPGSGTRQLASALVELSQQIPSVDFYALASDHPGGSLLNGADALTERGVIARTAKTLLSARLDLNQYERAASQLMRLFDLPEESKSALGRLGNAPSKLDSAGVAKNRGNEVLLKGYQKALGTLADQGDSEAQRLTPPAGPGGKDRLAISAPPKAPLALQEPTQAFRRTGARRRALPEAELLCPGWNSVITFS